VTRGRLPANSYIKEIRFGGADALDTPIQYSSSSDNILDIVLGPANAEISGNVVDKRRQPVFDVQVVLIPNKPRRRPDLFKQVFTDASGRFTLRNVVPGDYKLFALESIEQYSWFDPVVLESLETNAAKGEAVHVDEGGKTTINLTSIPGRPE
jgi:hypothetical protein